MAGVQARVWSRVRADGLRFLFLGAMTLGAAFILASSVVYFDFHELPPFAIEKLPVRFSTLWLASLRVHVTAALLSLPLCILLIRWFGLCVLAVLLVPVSASADDPPAAVLQRRVEKGLLEPLAQQDKERSRFSRASPPQERRVRVTQAAVTLDASGRAYMAFAVDVRRGSEWRKNEVVGCGYTQTGALFVKWGDDYRPAEILPTLERAARPSGRL
jgi:hypothetical protein